MNYIINNVDFNITIQEAITAVKEIAVDNGRDLLDMAKYISHSYLNSIAFIARKKESGEFDESDAKAFMEDEKILLRIRIRSMTIISLQIIEDMINIILSVFSSAVKKAIGWIV